MTRWRDEEGTAAAALDQARYRAWRRARDGASAAERADILRGIARLEAELDGLAGPRPPQIRQFLRWSAWLEGLVAEGAGPDRLLAELRPDPRRRFDPLRPEDRMTSETAQRILDTVAANGGRVGDGQTFVDTAGLADEDVFDLDQTGLELLDPVPEEAAVGVLLPLRLETRYRRPAEDGGDWTLRIRVHPDPVATVQPPSPATWAEAQALAACLNLAGGDLETDDGRASWASLVAAYGGPRAAYLLRSVSLAMSLDGAFAPVGTEIDYRPAGTAGTAHGVALPERLVVWGDLGAGPQRLGELAPLLDEIEAQTDFETLAGEVADDADHRIPRRWWTSYAEAERVGLATEVPLGPEPALRWLAVIGLAEPDAPLPFASLAAEGRLGTLDAFTPTNSVAGGATADLGDSADAWHRSGQPLADPEAIDLMGVLTGGVVDGVYVPDRPQPSAQVVARQLVTVLWPALWQRMLKDVADAGADSWTVGAFAVRTLAPLGPWPSLRVDDVPYGVLPVVDLDRWRPAAHDDPGWVELLGNGLARLLPAWAAAAETAGTATGADPERLLDLIGTVPTSRELGARLLLPVELRVLLAAAVGDPGYERYFDEWARDLERWAELGVGQPPRRLTPYGRALPLLEGGEPLVESIDRYFGSIWEDLAFTEDGRTDASVLARLIRHSLLLTQAEVNRLDPDRQEPWRPALVLPIADPGELASLAQGAPDVLSLPGFAEDALAGPSADPRLVPVVRQFHAVRDAVRSLPLDAEDLLGRALTAVVDASAHRVDPWATALAVRRLRRLSARGAGRRLGAYGWVDYLSPNPDPTPPTTAGLLHAPGYGQALTSAVLRDRAISPASTPGDDTWELQVDSASARLAKRLGDDVRMGIHLAEALGREVERRAGEPGRVVELRRAYPARPEWAGRRVCDGLKVLEAAAAGALPWLPAVEDLQRVIDTYGDLLVADAVHDVVSGRGGAAAEAMEAAAGLAAPAELRMLRTQREGTAVRTTVVAALPFVTEAGPGAGPAGVADPMVAALLADQVPASSWTFVSAGATVTLADLGLTTADALLVPDDRLRTVAAAALGAPVDGGDHAAARVRLERLVALLGTQTGVPEGFAPDAAAAGAAVLRDRLTRLVADAGQVLAVLALDPPDLAAAVLWGLPADPVEAAAVLTDRVARVASAAADPALDAAGAAEAIRSLLAPVATLPLVCPGSLPLLPEALEDSWLEVVAAVRPPLARLEATRLATPTAWPMAASAAPWEIPSPGTRTVVAVGPGVGAADPVGVALLDDWGETVPSDEHATWATFGFDSPRARAPQAVLLAVPPDESAPWDDETLRDTVLAARQLGRARMAGPGSGVGEPLAPWRVGLPSSLLLATGPAAAEVVGR